MSRDLLTKPTQSNTVPEDGGDGKAAKRAPAPASPAPGVPLARPPPGSPSPGSGHGRGDADEGSARASPAAAGEPAAAVSVGDVAGGVAPRGRTPAYRAAYFTQDVSSVRQVNPRTRPQQALRGSPAATDLRQVTLPDGAATLPPDVLHLEGVSARMGLLDPGSADLGGLLARKGAELQRAGATAESIGIEQARLEARVAGRRQVLARVARLTTGRRRSSTLDAGLAQLTGGAEADAGVGDPIAMGRRLVDATEAEAEGLHRALRKVLGLKT